MSENLVKFGKINKRIVRHNSVLYTFYKQRYLFIMLLPTLIFLLIFAYKPILGWIVAFTDYKIGRSMFSGKWIGLSVFKEIFFDSHDVYNVLRNTLVMNIGCLITSLVCSVIFAILLNELISRPIKVLVQSFSLFPFFISMTIAYALMQAFLSVNSGLLNMLLVKYGIVKEGFNILGDTKYAWGLVICVNLWKSLGYNSIMFLAAITGID